MNAGIDLPRVPAALGRPLTTAGSQRATSLEEFDRRIENMVHCVHWLVGSGIKVTEAHLSRRGWVVTIAPSPWLFQLFDGDCSWRKRRQDGALTIFTRFAVRFGTRIEWEEVACA